MPLQKSFSEQNHSSKQRPLWNRNRSFQGPQGPKANLESRPLQDKSPVLVSAATKNMLSSFQFRGQPNSGTKANQPVISLLSSDDKENTEMGYAEPRDILQEGANKSADSMRLDPERNALPSTPAGRLALPDLIEMGDIRRAVQDVSPEDRIEWNGIRSSNSSFGGKGRATKRARSSSPTSSPHRQASTFFNGTSKAPVDPGSELWGRYSLNGSNAPTPQGPSIPALTHIMHTSSPQSLKEGAAPRYGGRFRRANSCGNQFPKRRRVAGPEDEDIFTGSVNMGPSKLSVLLERVQEGLTQPKQLKKLHNTSSSSARSSHLSTTRRSQHCEDAAPHEQKSSEQIITATTHPVSDNHLTEVIEIDTATQSQRSVARSNESDYGEFDDDDLDATLLDVFVSTPEVPASKSTIASISIPPPEPPPEQLEPSTKVQLYPPSVNASRPIVSSTLKDGEDQFDESDDDLFAADLEDIIAKFDANTATENKILPGSKQIGVVFEPSKGLAGSKADSEDAFGDGGFNDRDLNVAEAAAIYSTQQTANSLLPSAQKVRAIQRYLVTNVVESEFEGANGRMQREKILFLQIEHVKIMKRVNLRGIWFETPVNIKAFVHVIGNFDRNGRCIIDDNNNMLILHPDHLISSTVVADSFGCTRRAVLQDRVKATSDSTAPLVYGTILHEIFQSAMLVNRWDTTWLTELIEKVATGHIEDLYAIKLQIPQAVEYLQSKMGELQSWAELFVSSQPKPEAIVKAGNGETASMCVNKLLDVEEHVWSPMYGLKGNIDATVQVTMRDGKQERTLTVPFEVKTGKNPSAAHRAQTALYNLLLSDRYDVEIAYGILYYMETSETIRIPAIRHELRHMIMQRNELACFVRERHAQLPKMLKKENMCNRCYAKVPCFIYHKLADNGNGETSGMKAKFDDVVKHLTPKHKDFFLKWDDLLTKEEKESLKFRRELWTMLSSEREKLGRCFSNVIVEPGSAHEEQGNPKINRYRYTLIKQTPPEGFSFLDSQIIAGEPIVISDEKGHFALANGYVTQVRKLRITVAVDRRLHNARIRRPGFEEIDNQVFASIMDVAPEGCTEEEAMGKIAEEPVQYRLDKDEFSNGMATVRNNLIQVMAEGPFGSREIRSLVVDLNAPRFKTNSTAYTLQDRENINVDQRRAIQKVMSAQDYALVLGMPGTGKTTTIAHIIRALVSQGKSVLLTSYTHTAVDNILLKLKTDNLPILRLGTIAKINSDVQRFVTLAATSKTSFEEIRSAWHESPIVATTCLGINHAIFNERTFDYCIVDEASQITLPVCLGPIRLARTFILVGDHNQLPPLVQNEEARAGGLDVSLFKHLSDMYPSSVVYLEHQYRMCADVMALSNNLIYNGRLKCGSQKVADSRISIPNMGALKDHHYTPAALCYSQNLICLGPGRGKCWIRDLLDPSTKVSFINTDPLLPASLEEAKGNRIVNPTEASICVQLVESLLAVGVPASSIGVMTHYRSQLALLKHGLRSHVDVEMHTADRFQGRDKEVIILSLVRSNEAKSIGELLKDWRRINVAFTRAKTKLLVIGSRGTLKGNGPNQDGNEEMVARFVGLMEEKGWVYDLPVGALQSHHFQDGATQVSTSEASRPAGTLLRPGRDEDAGWKRKRVLEGKENGNAKREPKKIYGSRPFKIPRMTVLADILNEALH